MKDRYRNMTAQEIIEQPFWKGVFNDHEKRRMGLLCLWCAFAPLFIMLIQAKWIWPVVAFSTIFGLLAFVLLLHRNKDKGIEGN